MQPHVTFEIAKSLTARFLHVRNKLINSTLLYWRPCVEKNESNIKHGSCSSARCGI